VDQTLGVDPAQAVTEHVELAGPIADDDGILEQAVVVKAAGDRGRTWSVSPVVGCVEVT
jgi:hypothetical protein